MRSHVTVATSFAVLLAASLTAAAWAGSSEGNSPDVVTPELEAALLTEDWHRVADLLDHVHTRPQSPPQDAEAGESPAEDAEMDRSASVLRLIKGHACLALNRNNEAACMFLSARHAPAVKAWRACTERFVEDHPGSAVAHYLHSDALSRSRQWELALAGLEKALKASPDHALTLNARGVAHAATGDLRLARVDFADAIKASRRQLADPYANIGALCLQRKDGAEGGLRAFNDALDINPDFALALHGRGYVRIVLAGKMDEEEAKAQIAQAKADLQKAEELSRCEGMAMLFLANKMRYSAFWNGMEPGQMLASLASGEHIGTTIDAQINRVEQAWNKYKPVAGHMGAQREFNEYWRQMGVLQRLDPMAGKDVFNSTVKPDLEASERIRNGHWDGFNTIERTNKVGGFSSGAQSTMRGLGGAVNGLTSSLGASYGGFQGAAAGGVVGSITQNTANKAANTMRWLSDFHMDTLENYKKYDSNFGSGGDGGVDADLSGVVWDDGHWPFTGYFALSYSYNDDDLPLDEMRKTLRVLAEAENDPAGKDKPSEPAHEREER